MKRAEAGRPGEGVRSDLHVLIEDVGEGGVQLEVQSKVESYYGDAIAEQALSLLKDLGIENARVRIEDGGALPFVIGARLEAAALRAEMTAGAARRRSKSRAPTARDRLRRSRLYLPGNEPKYMVNAGLHGADGVILDLEDSVHAAEKDAARLLVRNALFDVDFGGAERMVRINQLPLGFADLEEVVPAEPDLILIPKVEDAQQINEVDRRIEEIQGQISSDRPIWLMPIIETALGVERAYEVALASKRTVALTLGLEDLTADLGVPKTVEGSETLYARTRVVNAARAASMQAIDSVFGDVGDMAGLESWCRRSRGLGFEGMGCIHPRQIPVIHHAFAPSEKEITKALKIVAAFERAEAEGLGVVSLGSKMVDPPVVLRAIKLVNLARAMGLIEDEEAGR